MTVRMKFTLTALVVLVALNGWTMSNANSYSQALGDCSSTSLETCEVAYSMANRTAKTAGEVLGWSVVLFAVVLMTPTIWYWFLRRVRELGAALRGE